MISSGARPCPVDHAHIHGFRIVAAATSSCNERVMPCPLSKDLALIVDKESKVAISSNPPREGASLLIGAVTDLSDSHRRQLQLHGHEVVDVREKNLRSSILEPTISLFSHKRVGPRRNSRQDARTSPPKLKRLSRICGQGALELIAYKCRQIDPIPETPLLGRNTCRLYARATVE